MAHRIYIYNIDSQSGESYPYYLGEWNYEIPPLLLPLFASEIRAKGKLLYANREAGIVLLRQFYTLLADEYQLHYKKAYYEPVNQLFDLLENLPYDTFLIDGTDVFNMNEERKSEQAKDWVIEIQQKNKSYLKATKSQSLKPLDSILKASGYQNFLEALKTDWINYGLGYWNEDVYKHDYAEVFTENDVKGLKDIKGNIITPAYYDEISEFEDGIAVIQKNNKFGYLDTKGTEIVPPTYDDASHVFEIYYGLVSDYDYEFKHLVGCVTSDAKVGLINMVDHQLLIPPIYEELTHLYGNYFNAKTGSTYTLINHKNENVINQDSESPFDFDGSELFFIKIAGTSKRKYFNNRGVHIGDYLEDVLHVLPHNFFYVKPNKGNKKIEIIKSDGKILDTEIDQVITLSNYQTFVYLKAKKWFIYNPINENYLKEDANIQKIEIDYLANFFKDIYILYTEIGNGIFDAFNNHWLLEPNASYLKIEQLEKHFLRVHLKDGMQYWDGQTNQLSPIYEYVSEVIDHHNDELFLYQKEELFCLDKLMKIRKITPEEMGKCYNQKENLRGKDLAFFLKYYTGWKSKIGANYFHYFDNQSLYELGLDLLKKNKIEEAIEVLKIGVQRKHPQMMTELAMIYTDTEDQVHANLALGLALYEKAAKLGEKNAWNNLGYHYQNGLGCKKDIDKAVNAYTKAGELGNGLGWANLGDLYYHGQWVEKDEDKALDYYLKAQKLYYFNSDKLADIYFTKEDYKKVLPLLKKDYDEEFSPIYYGIMYERGLGGLKINLKKAISYYEKAMQIGVYHHAVNQLLYYYRPASEYADEVQFAKWYAYAEENNIEIDLKILGLDKQRKDTLGSFFKNLFKK
ncbi:SEL1-like repeat protein [Sphingobacterium anhuiense]|uniref:SEL1-like repeat protein n=1 Tax=Sphingobacterium anhuiense TaxID=493780 RepID=UPI003C2D877D